MLLQRFTKPIKGLICSTIVLLLVGCAGGTAQTDGSRPDKDRVVGPGPSQSSGAGDAAAEIPAQVLRMFEDAAVAMASGDTIDAELRFKEFLLQYPQYPVAHVNLAIIHGQNDNDEAARASIDAALALNPNHAAALNQLGLIHRKNGKFLEAEAAYLKAVTVSPEYALAHYNLGVLNELYLQRLDVALQHFETYQSIVGEDKQVERWITDLRRRVAANQRTANVAE